MNCQECTIHYYGYLTDAEKIPSGAWAHISSCAECRQKVEQLRSQLSDSEALPEQNRLVRKHLKLHARLLDQWVCCGQVRPFLPALLVDAARVTVPTPVTVHIEHCPQCRADLGRLRDLHLAPEQLIAAGSFMAAGDQATGFSAAVRSTLQAMVEAEPAGIETRMESGDTPRVKVRHGISESRQSVRARSVRRILTGGAAVAAVLLVIMLLPASAIGNLEKVNRAVKSVSEVYLQRYNAGGDRIQEIWMSKSLGFKIYQQPQKTFFMNMRSGQALQLMPGSEPLPLADGLHDQDMYARLLPFDQLKDLPSRYEWNFVETGSFEGKHVHFYELTWQHKGMNVTVSKKWRAALDPETYLPYQIEWLEKMQAEQDYLLITRVLVQYPSHAQFLEKLEKNGFQRFLTEDQVE